MDLRNIFRRKPAPLPHVVFSRSKAAARKLAASEHEITARLASELAAQGKYVPAYFSRISPDNQEGVDRG